MNRLWAPLLLALLLMVPVFVHAQSNIPLFDPEWQLVPEASELDSDCPVGAPLGFGGVLQLIQNVMNASVSFGVIICVIVIAFAGILWILTPTNPESHSQAKKVLTNAVIGFLIILSAWVMVDFVMKMLYSGTDGQQGVFGPWNEILTGGDICVVATSTKPLFSGNIFSVPGQSTGGSGGSVAGQCSVPTVGPCTQAALQNTCFGSKGVANQAAQICGAESQGVPFKKSNTDRLVSGDAYSVGLFQINLTNSFNQRVGGKLCKDAFTGPCQNSGGFNNVESNGRCRVSIKDRALYNACVSAAQNAATNIAVACTLHDGDWGRWSTAKPEVCNLPR
jgi:hypothetical protein